MYKKAKSIKLNELKLIAKIETLKAIKECLKLLSILKASAPIKKS